MNFQTIFVEKVSCKISIFLYATKTLRFSTSWAGLIGVILIFEESWNLIIRTFD